MKSVSFFVVCLILVMAFMPGPARTQSFALYGTEHLDVTSYYLTGILWDSSTADVTTGGAIMNAYLNGTSNMTISDGYIGNLYSSNTSNVSISGGQVAGNIYAHENSMINITGGSIKSLQAIGASVTNIFGGNIFNLSINYSGKVNMFGGNIERLYTHGTSKANIYGGNLDYLIGDNTSITNIYGGNIHALQANNANKITFYGSDFHTTNGLFLFNTRVLGTGILTGKWIDGTPWTIDIVTNTPSATIKVITIPEPTSLLAFLAGLMGFGTIIKYRKK